MPRWYQPVADVVANGPKKGSVMCVCISVCDWDDMLGIRKFALLVWYLISVDGESVSQ